MDAMLNYRKTVINKNTLVDGSTEITRDNFDINEMGYNFAFKVSTLLREIDLLDPKYATFKVITWRLGYDIIDGET